jgi:proteasome lid subunit RPN8/RPN11
VFAVLVGTIVKENDTITEIRVEDIDYPPTIADHHSVEWNATDVLRLQVAVLPRQVVGTLHSHPGYDPHISKQDIASSYAFGEVVMGIFSWWKESTEDKIRQTSFDWYCGIRPLEVGIVE